MIVDDSDSDVYLARYYIEESQAADAIITAPDGQAALDLLDSMFSTKNSLPNVILLDINMPRVDGFEFLDRLEGMDIYKHQSEPVVVVMLTSSDHGNDRNRANQFKFVRDYITKPLVEDHVQKLLRLYNESLPQSNKPTNDSKMLSHQLPEQQANSTSAQLQKTA